MGKDLPPLPSVLTDWASSDEGLSDDDSKNTTITETSSSKRPSGKKKSSSLSFSRSNSRSVNRQDSSDRPVPAGNNGLKRIMTRGCIRPESSDNVDSPVNKRKSFRSLFSGLGRKRSNSLSRGSGDDEYLNNTKPVNSHSGIRNLFRRRSSIVETNRHHMVVNRGPMGDGVTIGVPELYYQPLSTKFCYRDKLVRSLDPSGDCDKLCVLGQDETCIRLSDEVIKTIMRLDMPFFVNPNDLDGPSETWENPIPFNHPINQIDSTFDQSSLNPVILDLWKKYSGYKRGGGDACSPVSLDGVLGEDAMLMPEIPAKVVELPPLPARAIASEICSDLHIFLKGCQRIRMNMLDERIMGKFPRTKWGVEVISPKNKIYLNRLTTAVQPFQEHEIKEVLRELELSLRNLNDVQLLVLFQDTICNENDVIWSGRLSTAKRSFRDQILRLLPTAVFLRCVMIGIDPARGQSRILVHQGFSESCTISEKWDLEAQKMRSIFAPDEMSGKHIDTLESYLHSLLKSVTAEKGWALLRRFGTEIIFINGIIELVDPEYAGEFSDVEWWSVTVDVKAPKKRGIYYNCRTHQIIATDSKRKFHHNVCVVAKDPTNIDSDTYRWSAVPAEDIVTPKEKGVGAERRS